MKDIMRKLWFTALLTLVFFSAHANELRKITVGYSDTLPITKEAASLICFGFEADHPNNSCYMQYVDAESMWDLLMNNEIQVALMPEEVLISHKNATKKPVVITPLYQQYLIFVGNDDLDVTATHTLKDRTIGVSDWTTKEYRGKPLFKSLGLKEQDVYFPIANTSAQLVDNFCNFSLDGVMLMSDQSSALARELTTSCDGQILSFSNEQLKQVMKNNPGFYPGKIPKGLYWRMSEDVNTLRSRIILVINPSNDVITAFFKSLDNINEEINLLTLRHKITPKSVLETYDINPIPLHPLGKAIIDQIRKDLSTSPQSPPQIPRSSVEFGHEN